MEYKYLKEQLLSMFDSDKLHLFPEEWGFFNETERDIKRIGICFFILFRFIFLVRSVLSL